MPRDSHQAQDEPRWQVLEAAEGVSRRGFVAGAGLLGMTIPFHSVMPTALASDDALAGKDGLTLLNDLPLNAETPAHLLDDAITPTSRHFIRNNGLPPENVDAAGWTLAVDGLVNNPAVFSINELRARFEVVTMALTIECGGNGRAFFDPPVGGEQWTMGAVGCAEWTGVRLADVLKNVGVRPGAVYTAHYSADTLVSGDEGKLPISRGVPIAKAMTGNVLIAFAMNGGPLHRHNGAPLRLVVPGWPGACSQKWLRRVEIRDQVHDGPKMTGTSYRVPRYPVAPGDRVPEEDFDIIERMPVKSLVTAPEHGAVVAREIEVRGHAWSGDRTVSAVDISTDLGRTWMAAELDAPVNPGAWQNWRRRIAFPQAGYYEVWSRASDSEGDVQPFAIDWNPKGYLNNSVHRIALRVT